MLWFRPPLVIHFSGCLRVFLLVGALIHQAVGLTIGLFMLQFVFIKIFLAKFKIKVGSFGLGLLFFYRFRRLFKRFLYIIKLWILFAVIFFNMKLKLLFAYILGQGLMRKWVIWVCWCFHKLMNTTGRYRTMTQLLTLLNSANSSQLHWSADPMTATQTFILERK